MNKVKNFESYQNMNVILYKEAFLETITNFLLIILEFVKNKELSSYYYKDIKYLKQIKKMKVNINFSKTNLLA